MTAHGDKTVHGIIPRVTTFHPPRCQKATGPGNLGESCRAVAPYAVLVEVFAGSLPHWFNACGKHAQLAVMAGRAFDMLPVEEWIRKRVNP